MKFHLFNRLRHVGVSALVLACVMLAMPVSAADFVVDGIAYLKHDDGTTVGVTSLEVENDYLGTFIYPDLLEANIPETVTYDGVTYTVTAIENDAFSSSMSAAPLPLKKVVIPNTVTTIGAAAFNLSQNIKSVTLGENVQTIGAWAFSGCSSLESIVLPDNLKSIDEGAFIDCSGLKTLTIGNKIERIGSAVFMGCSKLEDIYCRLISPMATATDDMIFDRVPVATCTLHVPIGTKALYQECEVWSQFENIVEDIEPDTEVDPWILLAGPRLWLEVGQVFQLNAWTTPADLPLAWTSSDESVATVDDQGVITAVAPGVTIITVAGRETGTPTATCEVTVKEAQKPNVADDVNGDGVVDIADVNHVINTMLSKGSR